MPNPADNPLAADAYTTVLAAIKELLPRNYIGGLITSNDVGDALHDVNIAAGECRGLADDESLRLATEITKQIDVGWAVGDDAGGIDAGAVAADTMYAVWLIKRVDTGVVDALFSLSYTAPNMPANYTKKRLIGSVCTDGGSDIIAYVQSGDYFRYTGDVIIDVDDNTIIADTWETGTLSVPPKCLAYAYALLNNPTTTSVFGSLRLRYKGAADAFATAESFAHIGTAALFDNIVRSGTVLVDAARQMEYSSTEVDGVAAITISTFGFTMLTRREP